MSKKEKELEARVIYLESILAQIKKFLVGFTNDVLNEEFNLTSDAQHTEKSVCNPE